jgi:hypothetical protein
MDDKKVAFAPFHAINQFMVPEFRQKVIHAVLVGMEQLDKGNRNALNDLIKKRVIVSGFRNSAAAPAGVKVKGSIAAFEKSAEFAARILQCWAQLNGPLAEKVYQLLTQRGWEPLPVDADRTKLPGFMTRWHATDTYEVLDQAFSEMFPDFEASTDDIRLMVVWLSNRLPYESEETEEAPAA